MIADERTSQKKIEEIFESASLNGDDRDLWRERLASAGQIVRSVFIDAFGSDGDALPFFTADLRKRIGAGNDREKLDEIAREEREYFSSAIRSMEQERI